MSYPILEVCNISKWFGKTCALSTVNLALHAGEIHVLAGENGAGKSTLIRVLSGALRPDAGELRLQSKSIELRDPVAARSAGIATIYQELSLVSELCVADNLFLGEKGPLFGPLDARARTARARKLLDEFGLDVEPDARVGSLPLGTRQLIEIARALATQSQVVIFDEPTSALNHVEAERLFEKIRELRKKQTAILYISHRMEEIYALADRISVLRDGHRVITSKAEELSREALIRHIVGSDVTTLSERPVRSAKLALRVNALTAVDEHSKLEVLRSVSFSAQVGEVLGIAGLQGSGASELLHVLFGSFQGTTRGSVELFGESPARGLSAGIVLLPGDRAVAAFPELSVTDNVSIGSLRQFSQFGFLDRERARKAVLSLSERLPIAAPELSIAMRALSGGNQQKALLLRCLLGNPKLLLLDEPTRGVDIGAKHEIYRLVRELVDLGMTVLWFSSELEELLEQSDRVLVLARGRVKKELGRSELSREAVLAAAMGAKETSA